MLQFYITTSFCVDIDHFNAKCRKWFLYIYMYIYICFFFFFFFVIVVFYILPTQHVEMYFFFYIFTSCVVPTVRKHHFRQHHIWNFHENHIPFFAFFTDSDTWVGLTGEYRESLWNVPLMWWLDRIKSRRGRHKVTIKPFWNFSKKTSVANKKCKHKVENLKDNDKQNVTAAQNDQNTVWVNVYVRHCFCCVIKFRAQSRETDLWSKLYDGTFYFLPYATEIF